MARLVGNVLRDFGFDSEWFRTVADLLRRVRTTAPDLCIVDLGLPDMDGMAIMRELRRTHGCGVLILTVRSHPMDRVMDWSSARMIM